MEAEAAQVEMEAAQMEMVAAQVKAHVEAAEEEVVAAAMAAAAVEMVEVMRSRATARSSGRHASGSQCGFGRFSATRREAHLALQRRRWCPSVRCCLRHQRLRRWARRGWN